MSFTITKTTTKTYKVTFCRPFMEYNKFVDARKGMRHTPKVCFCCGRKFKDDEMIYLGMIAKHKNEIFCKDCGEEIIKTIENKYDTI